MQFADLRLAEPILRSLIEENYAVATPIQAQAIPPALAGRDVLGAAQTGTGKTAAFALPILHRLMQQPEPAKGQRRLPRVLILCPTRELATQIHEGFAAYGRHVRFYSTVIFGGVSQHHQVRSLVHGTDVIIATPGRLLDLINQGYCDLKGVQTLVLDESDRMLDMGFIHDIRKITALIPNKRQTLLFSATMPTEIRRLADSLMHKPAEIAVAPVASVAANIDESVYFVEKANKGPLLAALYEELSMARTIVFTRTKHGADKVVKQLHRFNIRAEAIHGNKSQNARQRALDNFKSGKTPMLVATDIASRGIDVDMITHVVNYDLTHEPETYVHRIGRTARAGASGAAVSFCDHEERSNLRAIEKLIKRPLRVIRDLPALPTSTAPMVAEREFREPRHASPRQASQKPQQRTAGAFGKAPSHGHANASGGAQRPTHAAPAHRRPATATAATSHAAHGSQTAHGSRQAQPTTRGPGGGARPLGGRHQGAKRR